MFRIFRQPFPRTNQADRRVKTALAFGAFVFLFLFIFRPFGLQEMGTPALALAAFLYGLVCVAVLLFCMLVIPRIFPAPFEESGWTVWKEILLSILNTLAVTVGNIIFTHFYFGEDFNRAFVLKFLWMTFCVAIIPIIPLVLIRQLRLMKTFSRKAEELNAQLSELRSRDSKDSRTRSGGNAEVDGPSRVDGPAGGGGLAAVGGPGANSGLAADAQGIGVEEIRFTAENSQEIFEVALGSFLYAEAADNYVKIFYTGDTEADAAKRARDAGRRRRDAGEERPGAAKEEPDARSCRPEHKIIRSSLKRLEESIRGHVSLYRCHRTYIVNLEKVVHISGNAQGYKLHLDGTGETIPVSRNLNKEIAGLVTCPKTLPVSPTDL